MPYTMKNPQDFDQMIQELYVCYSVLGMRESAWITSIAVSGLEPEAKTPTSRVVLDLVIPTSATTCRETSSCAVIFVEPSSKAECAAARQQSSGTSMPEYVGKVDHVSS